MPRELLAHALGVVATLFLVGFLLVPLGRILATALGPGALEVLANPYYWERLLFTLAQALLSTLATVVVGLPGAILFGRFRFPGKRLLRSTFTIPFVMPTVVAAVGFLALLGPQGALALDLRGTLWIILLAHVFYNFPVVVRLVGSYLEASAPRLEEAARTLGASWWRLTWRVTLPLAAPALAAAAALVFVFTFTSFGVILILAPNLPTVEVEIYRLTARLLGFESAAVLVVLQLLVVALASHLYARLQARLALPLAGGGSPLPPARGGALLLAALLLLGSAVLVLSPLAALIARSLWLPGVEAPSLVGFRSLLAAPRTATYAGAGAALVNSLLFALATAASALAVGFAFAYAVVRGGWRWLDELSLLPLGASAVTLGLGYLLAFPGLAVSAAGVWLAHTLIAFPFVARALLPALRGIPRSLLEAGQTLGASPLARLRRIELPLLAPSLTTAAAFAVAVSLGEFGATLVLARPEHATIPLAIFDRLGRPGTLNYASALALAVLLMALTAAAMLALERSEGRGL